MAKENKKLKGEDLGICNPFPGTVTACLYKKQSDGSIKPAVWLTKPEKSSKEEFDAIIKGLNFRVISVRNQDGSETEVQEQENVQEQDGSQEQQDSTEEMPAD